MLLVKLYLSESIFYYLSSLSVYVPAVTKGCKECGDVTYIYMCRVYTSARVLYPCDMLGVQFAHINCQAGEFKKTFAKWVLAHVLPSHPASVPQEPTQLKFVEVLYKKYRQYLVMIITYINWHCCWDCDIYIESNVIRKAITLYTFVGKRYL